MVPGAFQEVPGTVIEKAMGYPRNGRTIRIPVQTARHQLPTREEEKRPMLAEPAAGQEGALDSQAAGSREGTDATKKVTKFEAELEVWQARASNREAEAKDLKTKNSELEAEILDARHKTADLQAEVDVWKAEVARTGS